MVIEKGQVSNWAMVSSRDGLGGMEEAPEVLGLFSGMWFWRSSGPALSGC